MSTQSAPTTLAPVVRIAQIIVSALCVGVIVFGIIAIAQASGRKPPAVPIVTYVSFVGAVGAVAARKIVPQGITTAARQAIAADKSLEPDARLMEPAQDDIAQADLGPLAGPFMTKTIAGAAPLEGGAFLALVAHMFEGTLASVTLAGALLAGIAMGFPTVTGAAIWAQAQWREIELMRRRGDK